ncbi:MAG: hypothetical protein H8E16_00880 [Flavobacteriales bacterium]|nr:hypothetical protein [Flavobacteriales bacterium]
MKKILLILLCVPFFVFSQSFQLYVDTLERSVPSANFGGQTWRGPSWIDPVFNDSVASMYPDVLAYPSSPDLWDWQSGWFYPQSILDTCCLDTLTLSWGQLNTNVINVTPLDFQNALNQVGTEGLYCLNMISSSMSQQLFDLRFFRDNGVQFERIRLGDEMGKLNNHASISHFPTAQDYALSCDIYIDSIRNILPNAKIAVSAGNFGANYNPRAEFWNEALYNMSNPADAFRWSAFFYMRDSDTLFTTEALLAYPFDQIPTYEQVRGFQDTISNLQDYELWVGYGITDLTTDKIYQNRWSLVLMFSASHNIFLDNNLTKDISMFNVAGIFENWDALDTQNNFRKRATGIFATIWNKAKLGKNIAQKIITPISLIDTVAYYNNNNVARHVEYPKLFGWNFENDSTHETSIILTNISSDTIVVSIDSIIDSYAYWEKWSSDSLFDRIDSVNYINLIRDTGLIDIVLLPYSINVASGYVCSQSLYNFSDSICVGDSVVVGESIYYTQGVYSDSLKSMYGCDSIMITSINIYAENNPIISVYDSILETDDLMDNYQWYFDGDSIIGANQFIFSPVYSGNYMVTYFDQNNCLSISHDLYYDLVLVNEYDNVGRLLRVVDVLGVESKEHTNNFLFYIYDDGTVEKRIIVQ